MSHLSIDEFRAALLVRPLEALVREYIFQGLAYAFRQKPESMEILHRHLFRTLNLSQRNVIVVGSAKLGFSLSPDTFPRQFSEESDIDVLVVDESLFDRLWLTLLKWQYPRRLVQLGRPDAEWASCRRKEVYWGWLTPDRIRFEGLSFPDELRPLRDISTRWFNAFRSLSEYREFAARNVTGRLYRTWHHAFLYHVEGLRQIREKCRRTEGE